MRRALSRGFQAKQRRRAYNQGLNWPLVTAVLVVAASALIYLKVAYQEDSNFELLRQAGAVFYVANCVSISHYLGKLLRSARTTDVCTTVRVVERGMLAFVPHTATLSYKKASPRAFQEELASLVETGMLRRMPSLATAMMAIAEKRDLRSAHQAWLQHLPLGFESSLILTTDQRSALHGTAAEPYIREHDELYRKLITIRPAAFDERPVTPDEASWALGLVLHLGLTDGTVLAPGLIDGVARHWDDRKCADLAQDVAPTGSLPGWALVAKRTMSAAEPVWLCVAGVPNGVLLAKYGIVFEDNPYGPVLQQQGLPNSLASEASAAAFNLGCGPQDVLALPLSNEDGAVLSEHSIRCASLGWMGRVDQALKAQKAGYFDTWPRRESISDDHWLHAEATFYARLSEGCNQSLHNLLFGVDDELLARLAKDKSRFSQAALLVRSQEQRLYEKCTIWAQQRIRFLMPLESSEFLTGSATHEEL